MTARVATLMARRDRRSVRMCRRCSAALVLARSRGGRRPHPAFARELASTTRCPHRPRFSTARSASPRSTSIATATRLVGARDAAALHTSAGAEFGVDVAVKDPSLRAAGRHSRSSAGRWAGECGRCTGARGFVFPACPFCAPLLAARWCTSGDTAPRRSRARGVRLHRPREQRHAAYSLLAMVLSLFETGYLRVGAGISNRYGPSLQNRGWPTRIGRRVRGGRSARPTERSDSIDYLVSTGSLSRTFRSRKARARST